MKGGSWDYIYGKFIDAADRLKLGKCRYRKVLADKIYLIADALKAVEWVDSGDSESPVDIEAIKDCLELLGSDPELLVLNQLIVEAKQIRDEISEQLIKIDGVRQ